MLLVKVVLKLLLLKVVGGYWSTVSHKEYKKKIKKLQNDATITIHDGFI